MKHKDLEEALERAGAARPTARPELWEGIEARLAAHPKQKPRPWRGWLLSGILLGLFLWGATRPGMVGLVGGKVTMLYQTLLAIGGIGILVQAGLGFAHHEGDGHNHVHTQDHDGYDLPHYLLLLSPLRLFSFSLGVGAAGMLGQSLTSLPPLALLVLALLAGLAFYRFVIQPLFGFVLKFASKPAETLSGATGQEAVADSRFDANGKGIVTVVVDGQLVRLLATLDGDPQPIEAGEKLTVVSVDTKRNQCTVVKL